MKGRGVILACALVLPVSASPAIAQRAGEDAVPIDALPVTLEVVDQGIADIGSLSASHRVQRTDQRVPTAFDRVYRVPNDPEKLMRIDGALRAVFHESEYLETREGLLPLVPAGTVWTFGDASAGCAGEPRCRVNESFAPAAQPRAPREATEVEWVRPAHMVMLERADSSTRVETGLEPGGADRVDSSVRAVPMAARAAGAEPAIPSRAMPAVLTMTDAFYRVRRLRQIAERYGPARDH